MRHSSLFFLAVCQCVFAGQSLVLTPGISYTLSDPTMNASTSVRVEFQMHNWKVPPAGDYWSKVITLSGTGVFMSIWPDGRLALVEQQYYVSPAQPCFLDASGRSNVLVRYQRDLGAKKITCELWNSDGSGYVSDQQSTTTLYTSGTGAVLGGNVTASLGFLRVATTLMPIGGMPPTTADAGNWTELKFDGNLTDSTGNGHGGGIVAQSNAFAPTVGQAPAAFVKTLGAPAWADWVTLRAGFPSQLDGSRSFTLADTSSKVSYYWDQIDGPSTAVWNDPTLPQPSVDGLIFGSYTFRLQVRDSNGNTASASLQVGAVATDDQGVVIYPDPRLKILLGPALKYGANPWEWFDNRNKTLLDYWVSKYENNGGTWRLESDLASLNGVPRNGTVFKNDSTSQIYGIGTNFLAVFCGGNIGPAVGLPYIVAKLPDPSGPNAAPRPYPRLVKSCQSDTQITMADGWQWERAQVNTPGVAWGTWNICTDCGDWQGLTHTSNINFYDNALAHYAFYYRSGYAKARDSARWLADRWYRSPWILSGVAPTPRDFGLTSAYIRAAIDGGMPDYDPWPSLRSLNDICFLPSMGLLRPAPIEDVRETAYCLAYSAQQALLDPDPIAKANAQARVVNAYSWQWGPAQQPNGNYINNQIEGDFTRTFMVSNGSTTVKRVLGPALPSNYCGTPFNPGGKISVGADRVTVFGTAGTNFVGSAGKMILLRGTLAGKPWSMSSQIAYSPAPTANALTLMDPWRGDPGSVDSKQWMILADRSINGTYYYNMFFGKTASDGSYPAVMDVDRDNWYWCTVRDSDTIVLDKPYTGNTSGGNVYRRPSWQNLTGRGSQPFMQGIAAWALNYASKSIAAYDPNTSAAYQSSMNKVVDWIWTYGRSPATKGLFYGVDFSNCQNLTIFPTDNCAQSIAAASNERAYMVETNSGFAAKYLNTHSSTDLKRGDQYYTDQFAHAGFASPIPGDGYFADLLDPCCSFYNNKAYGQAFGVGQGHQWPAARLGTFNALSTSSTSQLSTVQVTFNVSPDTTARLTVLAPSGARTEYSCTASPCAVQVDRTIGRHWVQIDSLTKSGQLISTSRQLLP